MAIRFYKNGTTGAQDGEEISNGDLSNPLVFDGMYPIEGTTSSKSVDICVRADVGERWAFVGFSVKGGNSNRIAIYSSRNLCVNSWSSNGGTNYYMPMVPLVEDKNISIKIVAYSIGSETNTPDTTCKIKAWGSKL